MQNIVFFTLKRNQTEYLLRHITNIRALQADDTESCYTWCGPVSRKRMYAKLPSDILLPANRVMYAFRWGECRAPLHRTCATEHCVNPHHFEERDFFTRIMKGSGKRETVYPMAIIFRCKAQGELGSGDTGGMPLDCEIPSIWQQVKAE